MKLDFSRRQMDIGTFSFNLVRVLSLTGTGGAEISECLLAAEKVKDNDPESWVREWATLAERVARVAAGALKAGQPVTARRALLRASNYYRAAMFSLAPGDERLDAYLTQSRELFHAAAPLCAETIEIVEVPYGDVSLPGYFLAAPGADGRTLLVVNGGDSTNEELVHWVGFAAVARGWNCLIFEGPGQWSAFQQHPELPLRPDFEVPVGAAVDYLVAREDVDPDRIALAGYSLGAMLAARAAAFEPRIRACVCDGLVTDVNAAWEAVMPAAVRNAPQRLFDLLFTSFEKVSPQLASFANHYRWIFNVEKPHEIFEAWKPFNVNGLAPSIACPLLVLYGEAEVAQSGEQVGVDVLRWLSELRGPLTMRMFDYEDGWAATHCQVGALSAMQAVVLDWLETAIAHPDQLAPVDVGSAVEVMGRHWHGDELRAETKRPTQRGAVTPA
ncbi:MAG: alpha/beta fold hydrolase [Solirubrobacteraceae bacterium]